MSLRCDFMNSGCCSEFTGTIEKLINNLSLKSCEALKSSMDISVYIRKMVELLNSISLVRFVDIEHWEHLQKPDKSLISNPTFNEILIHSTSFAQRGILTNFYWSILQAIHYWLRTWIKKHKCRLCITQTKLTESVIKIQWQWNIKYFSF